MLKSMYGPGVTLYGDPRSAIGRQAQGPGAGVWGPKPVAAPHGFAHPLQNDFSGMSDMGSMSGMGTSLGLGSEKLGGLGGVTGSPTGGGGDFWSAMMNTPGFGGGSSSNPGAGFSFGSPMGGADKPGGMMDMAIRQGPDGVMRDALGRPINQGGDFAPQGGGFQSPVGRASSLGGMFGRRQGY